MQTTDSAAQAHPVPGAPGAVPTSPWSVAAAGTDSADQRELVRAEALEQLMRLSADETHIYGLLECADPDAAAALVGRILASLNISLVPGCPLLAYGAGKTLDHGWRRHYPPAERSLYSELLFCRQLAGVAAGDEDLWVDAFAELEHLRDVIGVTDLT